jgi:hypothetical protein
MTQRSFSTCSTGRRLAAAARAAQRSHLGLALVLLLSVQHATAFSYTRENYQKKLARISSLGSTVNANMAYNGGHVNTDVDIVLIFLGAWSSTKAKATAALITFYAANSNGTLWLKTGRRYIANPDKFPANTLNPGNIRLKAVSTIIAPRNSTFTDKGIRSIIRRQITTGSVPLLPTTGAYFILTTPDVKFEDHCTAYCGYHGIFSYQSAVMSSTVSLAYRWVGGLRSWAHCCCCCSWCCRPASLVQVLSAPAECRDSW